ncbi:MAG: hypothetical protein A4E65_01899 [Syntrophorhabdus sp. PtaU1.Bin153]|nr:MAG: hypothetical protein A4E65_01899 [Syntrophorhabdus sp. PtaU1.Bin153]
MFGGPGETRQTVEETIDFIANSIPRKHLVVCVSAIRIFKGTQLEKIAIKEGQINENTDFLKPVFYCSNDVQPEYIQSKIKWTTENLPNCLPLEDIKIRGIKKLILGLTYIYLKLTRNNNPMWVYLIKMNNLKRKA